MRYLTRQTAYDRIIPAAATIIRDTRSQVAFIHLDQLIVVSFIEMKPACPDCTTLWAASRVFDMRIDELLEKA